MGFPAFASARGELNLSFGGRRSLVGRALAWPEQLIHFVDFEGAVGCGILEFGVVSLRGQEILDTATGRCRPTGRVRAEDVAVHRLEPETLGDAPVFAEEFDRFAGLRESGPLAAHFATAEHTMIKSVWPYPRASADFGRDAGSKVAEWGPWVDTGRLYPQLYPDLPSAKLGELVAVFGLQAQLDEVARERCPADRCHYHAALYDALAGALLLGRLAAEPALAEKSLRWLLTMSTLDGGKRDALQQGDLFA